MCPAEVLLLNLRSSFFATHGNELSNATIRYDIAASAASRPVGKLQSSCPGVHKVSMILIGLVS